MPKKGEEKKLGKDDELRKEIACPRCGSVILDISRAPEIVRCIVCKHIFEIETEESRLRKGKEKPHRIRKLLKLSGIFKKPVEVIEEEEEEGEEIKALMSKEEKTRYTIVGISLALMIIFFILAATGFTVEFMKNEKEITLENEETYIETYHVQLDWLAFVMLGMICAFGPIGLYESSKNTKIVKLEERLADFLRDLAESGRSGQTLHEAIITASGGEYGELLPEIKHMAVQISWGISATEALNRFAKRVKTPLVNRAVTLINEASSAGGDVSKVLEAAANDTKEIQMLNRERKIQMSLYVAVIFVSFMVFLVVILIVYATFVPQMKINAIQQERQQTGESGEESALSGAEVGATFSPVGVDFDEIKVIFIFAALVHAVGDGIVAGLMGSGRISDGFKYSFVMIIIVFVIFSFLMPAASIG